jgi:hypothetical protein
MKHEDAQVPPADAGRLETPVRPPAADRYARAVLHDDGTLHNFILRVGGKPYRCACGCNVFHKPDREDLGLYQCNACEQQFEAA